MSDEIEEVEQIEAVPASVPDAPVSKVDALLFERRGYVMRGLANRVAQVDAELTKFGIAVDDSAPETATKPKARRR